MNADITLQGQKPIAQGKAQRRPGLASRTPASNPMKTALNLSQAVTGPGITATCTTERVPSWNT